jgi:hypothetical protein
MGRLPSWIIVAAVGVVVVLAAADAIRPTGESRSTGSPRPNGPGTAPTGLEGVLLLGDESCTPTALRLPATTRIAPPRRPDCNGMVWSDDVTLAARCTATSGTEIVDSQLDLAARTPGCAPAWRSDGALSVIRGGNLILWRRHARSVVFLSREELANELEGALERGRTYRLVEVAWHGTQAFFGIVAGDEPWQRALIAYAPEGVNDVIPELGQDISSVRVSPEGSYVAFVRETAGREIVVLDGSEREQPLPRIGNVRAIAWSPDERWVALSTRTRTFIARAGTARVVLQIPVGGESLAWLP